MFSGNTKVRNECLPKWTKYNKLKHLKIMTISPHAEASNDYERIKCLLKRCRHLISYSNDDDDDDDEDDDDDDDDNNDDAGWTTAG